MGPCNSNPPCSRVICIYQGKEKFANNEDNINIAIGLLNELSIIIEDMDEYAYILNPNLHNLIFPIKDYCNNLFTTYKIVNAYKLYDFLNVDLQKLNNFLKNLENN